jgi:DNA-binding NarL/FixJ family response regulator
MNDQLRSIRLLLVDDNPMMLDGLKMMLRQEPSVFICGEACNGKEALEKLDYLDTDIVITDINMPVMNGIELAAQIKVRFPMVEVIALTMYTDTHYVKDILEAGAAGYVLKNTEKSQLLEAIKLVATNNNYYSPEITGFILDSVLETNSSLRGSNQESRVINLTERERSILQLSAEGCSKSEIGKKLLLQSPTVDMYFKNIFRKTNTRNIKELVNYGLTHHLIRPVTA